IPADKQRLLFQPFSQVDSSLARKHDGTGLGLAISAQLAALMGGAIWVESEAGRGSTFHFTARFGLAAGPAGAPPGAEAGLHGRPVLVVDDCPTSRRVLGDMLASWGMRPTALGSRAEALAALEATAGGEPFALALLDGDMLGVDGFELAGRILQD